MLYSDSPRGSARPTSSTERPLRGPVVRHFATCEGMSRSFDESCDESKSNFGARTESSMPHAFRISSETLIVWSVFLFCVAPVDCVVPTGCVCAVCGGGLGSLPQPAVK